MGKILSALGIVFGLVALLAAFLLYFALSGISVQLKNITLSELDRAKNSVVALEGGVSSIEGAINDTEVVVGSLSSMMTTSINSMKTLGDSIDSAATTFSLLGINVTTLRSAAASLKALNVSEFTQGTQSLSSRLDDVGGGIGKVKSEISGVKGDLIKMRGTIEDIFSTLSRVIFLLSAFLAAIALSLIVYSLNSFFKGGNGGKEERKEKK